MFELVLYTGRSRCAHPSADGHSAKGRCVCVFQPAAFCRKLIAVKVLVSILRYVDISTRLPCKYILKPAARLSLAELEFLSRFRLSVLLAFNHSVIAGQ
jgi:hypothetical protein